MHTHTAEAKPQHLPHVDGGGGAKRSPARTNHFSPIPLPFQQVNVAHQFE